MNGILKTSYIKKENGQFVVRSLLAPFQGTGPTRELALQDFYFMHSAFQGMRSQEKQRKESLPAGRPRKNDNDLKDLHVQVKPLTKVAFADLSRQLGVSQGELIELLLNCYSRAAEFVSDEEFQEARTSVACCKFAPETCPHSAQAEIHSTSDTH